jgi:hypothetical protein
MLEDTGAPPGAVSKVTVKPDPVWVLLVGKAGSVSVRNICFAKMEPDVGKCHEAIAVQGAEGDRFLLSE